MFSERVVVYFTTVRVTFDVVDACSTVQCATEGTAIGRREVYCLPIVGFNDRVVVGQRAEAVAPVRSRQLQKNRPPGLIERHVILKRVDIKVQIRSVCGRCG